MQDTEIEQRVTELYRKVLLREPDENGLQTYVKLKKEFVKSNGKKGHSLASIERILYNSEEYNNRVKPMLKAKEQKNIQKQEVDKKIVTDIHKEKLTTVNVFLLTRNNEKTLDDTFTRLTKVKNKYEQLFDFYYWIMENDSSDNTDKLIKQFMSHNKGRYSCGKIQKKHWGSVRSLDRVLDMACYRNMNKVLCNLGPMNKSLSPLDTSDLYNWYKTLRVNVDNWVPFDGKYSVILDTEISFDEETFINMVKILHENPKIGMVTPFGYVNKKPDIYYDTYALRTENDKSIAPPHWNSISDKKYYEKVKSAFSGFVVIRTPILEKCAWSAIDANCSEHNSFCAQVNKFGSVVICPAIKVGWEC